MSTPSKTLRQPGLIVYLCGLGTSTFVLWLVHYLNESHQFNIMGWYVNGIIPGGALVVGMISGLGYAGASRYLHVKLTRLFVFGMIGTALLDYTAAQYLTYTHILERFHVAADRYTFLDYIREICEKMTFRDNHSDKPGSPLGMFGYVFKLLEMAGYALGAMVPSLTVFGMPYCKKCQQYLKAHRTAYIHSPDLWSNVKKLRKQERLARLRSAVGTVTALANQTTGALSRAPLAETESALAALDSAIRKDAAARITFLLKKCPTCEAHHLQLTLNSFTADKRPATSILAKIDKTEEKGGLGPTGS